MGVSFVHVKLIARDWKLLCAFPFISVFSIVNLCCQREITKESV